MMFWFLVIGAALSAIIMLLVIFLNKTVDKIERSDGK